MPATEGPRRQRRAIVQRPGEVVNAADGRRRQWRSLDGNVEGVRAFGDGAGGAGGAFAFVLLGPPGGFTLLRHRRLLIYALFGDCRELFVGGGFFVERVLQQLRGLGVAEVLGEGASGSVAGNLDRKSVV